MGKFYALGGPDEREAVGINLVDMTTGVFLFMWDRIDVKNGNVSSVCLTPDQAEALARELLRVAAFVREDNE